MYLFCEHGYEIIVSNKDQNSVLFGDAAAICDIRFVIEASLATERPVSRPTGRIRAAAGVDEGGRIARRDVAIDGRDLLSFDRAALWLGSSDGPNASYGVGVAAVREGLRRDGALAGAGMDLRFLDARPQTCRAGTCGARESTGSASGNRGAPEISFSYRSVCGLRPVLPRARHGCDVRRLRLLWCRSTPRVLSPAVRKPAVDRPAPSIRRSRGSTRSWVTSSDLCTTRITT